MEFEHSIGWDKPWNGFVPIREVRSNTKAAHATDPHSLDAIFEAGDYSSLTDME